MKSYNIFLLMITVLLCSCSSKLTGRQGDEKNAVLVFYKTSGFYHTSIPTGIAAIQKLGQEHHFRVDTTRNAELFTEAQLKQYKAVVFLNTTQDVLNAAQQTAFEQYIRSGKGFVGIHAAADTEYEWPWYNKLVGAYFASHPKNQKATIHIVHKKHPATAHLPDNWERFDEWYNFKSIQPSITVLATLDEKTYTGGTNGDHHPIAWYQEVDGGRSFYTAGGHTDESYSEPLFLQHLLGGIQYAIGK